MTLWHIETSSRCRIRCRISAEFQRDRILMRDPMSPGVKLAVTQRHLATGDSCTRCPQRGGSLFHNYKGFHSIVFLALVDGDCKFLWVDLGAAGSTSDAQIFKHTDLRHKIEDGSIGFPDSESLGIGGPKVNFFLLGDNAFPLKLWLMKPYSSHSMDLKESVFNYRISRGRTMVENAFGIPTSRFRIFQSPLQQEPPVVNRVVMACLVLHNLLKIR